MAEALQAQAWEKGTVMAVQLWAAEQNLDLRPGDVRLCRGSGQRDLEIQMNGPSNEIEAEIAAGGDLFSLEPQALHERIKMLDALTEEEDHSERLAMFHEDLLATETASVLEGLETDTQALTKAIQALTPWAPSELDPDRFRARMARQELTRVGDFRRAMAEPEPTSVEHGLTDDQGRPISIDKATGALERQRAEEARRARTLGRA
jgi:hypothetical protein